MQVAASDLTRRRAPNPREGPPGPPCASTTDGRRPRTPSLCRFVERPAVAGAVGRSVERSARPAALRRGREQPLAEASVGGSARRLRGTCHDVARPRPGGSPPGTRASPTGDEQALGRTGGRMGNAGNGSPPRGRHAPTSRGDPDGWVAAAPVRCGTRTTDRGPHGDMWTSEPERGGARGSRARRLAAHVASGIRPSATVAPGPITLGAQAPVAEDQRLRDAEVVVRAGDVASRPPA